MSVDVYSCEPAEAANLVPSADEANEFHAAAVLVLWVTFNPKQERFVNDLADQANALSQWEYRELFVVPKIA